MRSRLAELRKWTVAPRRRELEGLLASLRTEWAEESTCAAFGEDNRGSPVLFFAHWRFDSHSTDFFLSVSAWVSTRQRAVQAFVNGEGHCADLCDLAGTTHINRGIGTLTLAFMESLLYGLGVRRVTGWLSPVDIKHRARQVHFYEKNGYTVTLQTGRLDGFIVKPLKCPLPSDRLIAAEVSNEAHKPFGDSARD